MNLGPLNRRGVLYTNTPTIGDGGAPVDALTVSRNLYLTVMGEDTEDDSVIAARVSGLADIVWKSRWFEGLETEMQVLFEGNYFRVVKRKEIDRRGGWMIFGQQIR